MQVVRCLCCAVLCSSEQRENSTEIDDRKQGSGDFIAWRPRYRCVPHDMYTLSCVCMYICYIFIEERRENSRRRSMWHDHDPGRRRRRQRPNGHSRKIKLTAFVNLAVAFGPQNTTDRPSVRRQGFFCCCFQASFFLLFLVEFSPLADTANCHRRSIIPLNASFQLRVFKSKYIAWSDIFSINLKSHRAIYNKSESAIIISSDLSPWAVASSVSIIGVLVFNAFLSWKKNSSPPYAQLLISCCFRSNHLRSFYFDFIFFLYLDFSQFCPPAKKFYFKAGSPRDDKRAREMREKEIDRCLTFHHPSSLQLSLHLLLFCIFFFCLFPLMPFYFFVLLFIYIHICVVFFLMFSFFQLISFPFLFCLAFSFFRGGGGKKIFAIVTTSFEKSKKTPF